MSLCLTVCLMFCLMNSPSLGESLPICTHLCHWTRLRATSSSSVSWRKTCVRSLAMTRSHFNPTGKKLEWCDACVQYRIGILSLGMLLLWRLPCCLQTYSISNASARNCGEGYWTTTLDSFLTFALVFGLCALGCAESSPTLCFVCSAVGLRENMLAWLPSKPIWIPKGSPIGP